jgi:DNA-binding NtrC family response regulator
LLTLLVNVAEPYREAFEVAAASGGARVFAVDDDPGPSGWVEPPALCVVALSRLRGDCAGRVRSLQKALCACPVVVLAEVLGTEEVVRLMRLGVADLLALPATPADVAARALVHARSTNVPSGSEELIGHSRLMENLRRSLFAIAPMRSTVLLTGETGTGKGLVARLIHRLSDRRERPFVHVDCAALSPTMIESELFGHERGAFTGAVARHPGRLEVAEQGTVFLDEIADLEPALQAKLLRVLQDREYERIGGTKTLRLRARVVAATSHDLRKAIREGRFRADLFFRLSVVELRLPALRERIGDIPALVRSGLERLAGELALSVPEVGDSFYARLMAYTWPGNVRELMNLLERILVGGRKILLDAETLQGLLDEEPTGGRPANLRAWDNPEQIQAAARPGEREAIAKVLVEAGGNVARAARRLGVARSTLRYRIRQLGLTDQIPRD